MRKAKGAKDTYFIGKKTKVLLLINVIRDIYTTILIFMITIESNMY